VTRIRFRLPAWSRPPRRMRLVAVAAAPLVLASGAVPAVASGHAHAPATVPTRARTVAVTTAAGNRGLQPLSLPGLRARAVTVTLITGDRVRLTEVSSGRYVVAAVPGGGTTSPITFQGRGSPQRVTSLRAIPAGAGPLLATGQLSPGLFDVLWLATHGDTGPSGHIPVTLRYASHPTAAALREDATSLPGAAVIGASTAQGDVRIEVAASRAGSFWAALTSHNAATVARPGSPAPTALAGGAAAVWLTGHDTNAAAPRPDDGQPVYPVIITFTRTIAGSFTPQPCGLAPQDGGAAWLCPVGASGVTLMGVAGGGLDNSYTTYSSTCVKTVAAKPYRLCTAYQSTLNVPAGVYAEDTQGTVDSTDDADHTLEHASVQLDVPQLIVTGPTALTINGNDIRPITVSTPQPASPYNLSSIGFIRSTPDGTRFDSVTEIPFEGWGNFWALPTPHSERATDGSYTFNVELTLGAPLLTAQVTAPQQLPLHPVYPCDSPGDYVCLARTGGGMVRFSGSHTFQLVDAGIGSPADFQKIDARGKIAFIHAYYGSCNPSPWPGQGACAVPGIVLNAQLAAARQAGAVGVLFGDGDIGWGTGCCYAAPLPTQLYQGGKSHAVRLPFAQVDTGEEKTLTTLLAKGPVSLAVTDHGTSPYTYNLSLYQEGGLSAAQHYTLTSRQLAEITDSYHASVSTPLTPYDSASTWTFAPNQEFTVGSSWDFPGPRSVRDYYGPLSPSVNWGVESYLPYNGGFDATLGGIANYVFGQPDHADIGWSTPPLVPGARIVEPAVFTSQPGSWALPCAGCRQGSTFYPWFTLASGANPGLRGMPFIVGFAPSAIHLYDQAGHEIKPATLDGNAIYTLPAQQQRYRMHTSYQLTGYGTTDTTTTTWDFTSAQPTHGEYAPYGYTCLGTRFNGSTSACNVPPLVFLRYNANTSLGNRLAAPGGHVLQVTGYHQDPSAPPVTSLKLWLSTNGGTTWQQAHLTGGRNGTWNAPYTLPQLTQTDGYLSIKATATDAAGNDMSQTILDAVKLVAGTSGSAAHHGR
jgi:hypothetical protein